MKTHISARTPMLLAAAFALGMAAVSAQPLPAPLPLEIPKADPAIVTRKDGRLEKLTLGQKSILPPVRLPDALGGDYAVAFWIKFAETPALKEAGFSDRSPVTIIDLYSDDKKQRTTLRVEKGNFAAVSQNDGKNKVFYGLPIEATPGKWYFATYCSHEGRGVFYLNGDIILRAPASTPKQTGVQNIAFGNFDKKRPLAGMIFQPSIYKLKLSDEQIRGLHAQHPPPGAALATAVPPSPPSAAAAPNLISAPPLNWRVPQYEPQTPMLPGFTAPDPTAAATNATPAAPAGGAADTLHGRLVPLIRITPENAAGDETQRAFRAAAWRNERLHAQFTLWSHSAVPQIRLAATALRTAAGDEIPAAALNPRFVRYVWAAVANRHGTIPGHAVADILDTAPGLDLPAGGFRPVWLTVTVPAGATPGLYRGTLTATGQGRRAVAFPLEIEVLPAALPDPENRAFFLDLGQHPWASA
ncbi:MAG: LamG domain-containing protein, partial [Opitutaceae bacterium]|nr:LamG domain-containing protein [Opitutaceae bacterium]